MATFSALQTALTELNEKCPRPGIPKLELSQLYDLQTQWPKSYDWTDGCGVYFLLDESQNVAYVGKASCDSTVNKRLGCHFGHGPNRNGWIAIPAWQNERLRYIAVIVLPPEHGFEAAAIEEFMITRLQPQPRLNVVGRRAEQLIS